VKAYFAKRAARKAITQQYLTAAVLQQAKKQALQSELAAPQDQYFLRGEPLARHDYI